MAGVKSDGPVVENEIKWYSGRDRYEILIAETYKVVVVELKTIWKL